MVPFLIKRAEVYEKLMPPARQDWTATHSRSSSILWDGPATFYNKADTDILIVYTLMDPVAHRFFAQVEFFLSI
jgi:hypothetical protein